MGLLIGLTFILYKPFADWYALGYTKVAIWGGTQNTFQLLPGALGSFPVRDCLLVTLGSPRLDGAYTRVSLK